MAGLNSQHDVSEHMQMVTDCERRQRKLNEWEQEFITSIRTRLERGTALSEAQAEKLDAIWERVTS